MTPPPKEKAEEWPKASLNLVKNGGIVVTINP
jgi:hypothetical protein